MSEPPSSSRPSDITQRPPRRSRRTPLSGASAPPVSVPMLIAPMKVERLQSNSSVTGLTKTPTVVLNWPACTIPISEITATMIQP